MPPGFKEVVMQNKPQGRKKNISGEGKQIQTHGPAQQQGPVGSQNGYAGRQMNGPAGPRPGNGQNGPRPGNSANGPRRTGTPQRSGGGGMIGILIAVIVLLLGGGGGLSGLFSGGSDTGTPVTLATDVPYSYFTSTPRRTNVPVYTSVPAATEYPLGSLFEQENQSGSGIGDLLNMLMGGWETDAGNTDVSSLAGLFSESAYQPTATPRPVKKATATKKPTATPRQKTTKQPSATKKPVSGSTGIRAPYTTLKGNGKDTVTLMVYMCGTDLESRSAMGTRDLQEMLAARLGNNVRLIVQTGGCSRWRNNLVSSGVNQIWQVKNGKLACLEENYGTASMITPSTLASFIQYCVQGFPADRYGLILWDHGSGSVSGYGYDETNPRAGSMSLAGISQALSRGGVKFDFIGFDACLMATVENALMLNEYADYMIASEETEPGYGWYYTDWLNALGSNPSIPTEELGQKIVDDFVRTSSQQAAGQKTTLSLIDLAKLNAAVPSRLSAWAQSISGMIQRKEYKTVSNARNGAREFAQSNRLDQVDLVDLAQRMGTSEGAALADAVRSAVIYNRTSSNMRNAYGLSIYFPYQKLSNVDKAVSAYNQLGMDSDYITCIRQFANLELSGQTVSGGYSNPWGALSGTGYASQSAYGDSDLLSALLGGLLSGDYGRLRGMDSGNTAFLAETALAGRELTAYLSENMIDPRLLTFKDNRLSLPVDQWSLVQNIKLNLFFDDGSGYVDMGLDGLYELTEDGFIADTDGTWIAINDQPVPYYELTSDEDCRTGYVPALLNGDRVQLLISFDPNGVGYIVGARADYVNGETETVAKNLSGLPIGATIRFLCDYYTYEGQYLEARYLGDPITVTADTLQVTDVYIDRSRALLTYRLTDIYNQEYWTESYKLQK